ncbi:hypothetical protein MFMK1_002211 [Metallumcola ferriviriculae]|uniref:Colicin D immunity protein domain-containing protein n=1 Tax=Metallumcola ferriviriculae TaxID=3039180 RepID=A0AAU0UPT2_9FIRM|nr:hypothetical protein MFMK1_002211 [Desulfitibacteraceae bacterium MK1]
MDNNEIEILVNKLEDFISGKDRTLTIAGEIEVALDRLFSDNDEIQDYATYFASYRPSGGEYLYDEKTMAKKSEYLLKIIKEKHKNL